MPNGRVTGLFYFPGGEFTRQAEVTFLGHPGKLILKQQFSGIDEHGHLTINTELEGRVPHIPYGASVHIEPYTELYHYSSSGKSQPRSPRAGSLPVCMCPPTVMTLGSWSSLQGSVKENTEGYSLF